MKRIYKITVISEVMGSSSSVMSRSSQLGYYSDIQKQSSDKTTEYTRLITDKPTDNISSFSSIADKKKTFIVEEFSLPVVSITTDFRAVSIDEYKKWLQLKRSGLISPSPTQVRCMRTRNGSAVSDRPSNRNDLT